MAEIEELKAMVLQMAADNARLIQAVADNRPQAPPNAAAIRREKLAKLGISLRKSGKVKDFKDAPESKIKEWLKRFDQELLQLKKLSGIDNNLEREEYIDCIKDKLEYNVVKRLDTVFSTTVPLLTWDQVTKEQLQACLLQEFGSKETDVSAVLLQFGPNRLKKAPEMKVSEFYHLWMEQMPVCMTPTDANE